MKRVFFSLVVLLLLPLMGAVAQNQLRTDIAIAYLWDKVGKFTNVRETPGGKVKVQIPIADYNIVFALVDCKNGWWKILECGDAEGNEEADPICSKATGGYIHYSCIALDTRNYDGQTISLRSEPYDKGEVLWSTKQSIMVRPIDVSADGDWLKVKTIDGKHQGWISRDWLCSNPLTNCC